MSDGGIKGAIGQVAADIGEAVVTPVADEFGKAIEQGVQATIAPPSPQDPAAIQRQQQQQDQKQAEVEQRKIWANQVIDRYKKIDEDQKRVRMQKKQEEQAKLWEEQQTKQVKQLDQQQKQQKTNELNSIQRAARAREIKGGVGG